LSKPCFLGLITVVPLRIAVIDDHGVVRDGIEAMAARTDDLEFVGGAANSQQSLELLERHSVDIVLLDYRLGGESGLDLCVVIKQRHPETRVLFFTAFGNPELLTQAIRAGASGYILKDTNTSRLPDVLKTLLEDGVYFDPRLAGQTLLATVGGAEARGVSPRLGDRELTILRLVAEGKSNHEIAGELYLSPHTVKFHITRLLRKYNVRRRSELAAIAVDMSLLP
jgi:two-component system, NarL family, response regulator DevR